MADSEGVKPEDFVIIGEPVKLGQDCPDCHGAHYCDAVCFRFSPRIFYCLGCGTYKRHKSMKRLIQAYQMMRLLNPGD